MADDPRLQVVTGLCPGLDPGILPEALARWDRYVDLLYARNQVMNLTRVPREGAFERHFLDGILFQDLIPADAEVLDIGTGPGFPAVPLAILRPDLKITALDSSGKMLGFLREASNVLDLAIDVVQARAEEWGVRDRFDVVAGRAVAPLPDQLEISAAPAKVGGLVVPMRTPNDAGVAKSLPVRKLGLTLLRIESRSLLVDGQEQGRMFPVYQKTHRTPVEYPRRWAEMKRRPFG